MSKTPDTYLVGYQKFKLEWMLAHSYMLEDLIRELENVRDDMGPDAAFSDMFNAWEHGAGTRTGSAGMTAGNALPAASSPTRKICAAEQRRYNSEGLQIENAEL